MLSNTMVNRAIKPANKEFDMTYIVRTYRIDNGAHVAHLDRNFDNPAKARDHALAANCKAYTPFIAIASEA